MQPQRLRRIVRLLRRGGVIAYPTEAVFGLGCNPRNEAAVRRILVIKQRPAGKGLILIGAEFAQIEPFVQPLDPSARARIEATWPGPVTWLLPVRPEVPKWLRGDHDTLAVRVTAHPVAAAICAAWGSALVSTSANVAGRPPARSALAVRRQLGRWLDDVAPGKTGGAAKPTEIRDLRTGRVVRSGV